MKKKFDKDLANRFQKTHKFCEGYLSIQVYDSCQRFKEMSLPNKKKFYGSLTMENIIDPDYKHVERV